MGYIQLKLAKRMKKKAENSKRNREAQANHEDGYSRKAWTITHLRKTQKVLRVMIRLSMKEILTILRQVIRFQ